MTPGSSFVELAVTVGREAGPPSVGAGRPTVETVAMRPHEHDGQALDWQINRWLNEGRAMQLND